MTKLIGICTKSVEQVEEILNDEFFIVTYTEFLDKDFSKDAKIVIVDNLPKLLLLNNLPILDMKYYNNCWMKSGIEITKENIVSNMQDVEKYDFQHVLMMDYNLGNYRFITHLTEYQTNQALFCEKVHNILTRTKKETIDCSNKYRQMLKDELFNAEVASLYQKFLNKDKDVKYPEFFKFLKITRERQYDINNLNIDEDEGEEKEE